MRYSNLHRVPGSPYWYVYEINDDIRFERTDDAMIKKAKKQNKYKRMSTKCRKRREAERWVVEREKLYGNITPISLNRAKNLFLSTKKGGKVSRDHFVKYTSILNDFSSVFGWRHVHSVATSEIEQWIVEKNLNARNQDIHRVMLHAFFRWCLANGYCSVVPTDKVTRVKLPTPEIRVLTEAEEERLLAVLSHPASKRKALKNFGQIPHLSVKNLSLSDLMRYAFVFIALRTGLRKRNILELEWSHIVWEETKDAPYGMIRYRRGKKSIDRGGRTKMNNWSLPMSADLRSLLEIIRKRISKLLHPSIYILNGTQWKTDFFYSALECARIQPIRFHDLRKTFLTRVAKYTDPKTLQAIAGHTTISMTLQYYISTNNERKTSALIDAYGEGVNRKLESS